VLGLKLLLVALVLLLSAWHDLAASRRMTRMTRDNAGPIELRRFRRRAAWVGRIVLILSVVIVVLGVTLARGIPSFVGR